MSKEKADTSYFLKSPDEFCLDGQACVDIIRSALAKNAGLRLRVKGYSMLPFIRDNDVITLVPLPERGIGLGQVIAFTRVIDGKLVIHRLVGLPKGRRNHYITKGDSLGRSDCPVSRTDMLALVTRVERRGRPVSFGAGLERRLIVFLNGLNVFWFLFFLWKSLIPRPVRRNIKERFGF